MGGWAGRRSIQRSNAGVRCSGNQTAAVQLDSSAPLASSDYKLDLDESQKTTKLQLMFHGGPLLPGMYSSCSWLRAYAVQCAIGSSEFIAIRVDCALVGAYFSCGSDGSKIVQKFNLTHTVQDVRLFMESYAKPRCPL